MCPCAVFGWVSFVRFEFSVGVRGRVLEKCSWTMGVVVAEWVSSGAPTLMKD